MKGFNYICPYCFSTNKITDVEFRCRNKQCKSEPDTILSTYNGGGVTLSKQICFRSKKVNSTTMPDFEKCPECNETSNLRVCPKCHNNLPNAIANNDDMIISIIGARDSGKSSYVGVLIHELRKRIALGFNGAANFMDNESKQQYEERFGDYLYPKKNKSPIKIPQTTSKLRGNSLIGANKPILCDLKIQRKKFLQNTISPYTLVFFDAAGEDFDDEDVMFTVAKYISKSKGIIFLLDPFQNTHVRGSLPKEVTYGASTIEIGSVSSNDEIVLRVANLIRSMNKIKENQKINIPVAAAFSKIDAIQPLLPSNSRLMSQSPHVIQGKFDIQDANLINEEMRGLLYEWGEQEFINHLEINYQKFSLFSFSSFGSNPKSNGEIQPPKPHRIEDSMLWILKELKVID